MQEESKRTEAVQKQLTDRTTELQVAPDPAHWPPFLFKGPPGFVKTIVNPAATHTAIDPFTERGGMEEYKICCDKIAKKK